MFRRMVLHVTLVGSWSDLRAGHPCLPAAGYFLAEGAFLTWFRK